MADRTAVAVKRAKAESRLKIVATAASESFGVPFKTSRLPANRYPDLAALELVENVADFLDTITKKHKGTKP